MPAAVASLVLLVYVAVPGQQSAKTDPLTDLILRLWTPSPQAGRSSTVLIVQMDQDSILHSYWLHSLWHRTASYTCGRACASTHTNRHTHTHKGEGHTNGIIERKQSSVKKWTCIQISKNAQIACYMQLVHTLIRNEEDITDTNLSRG